jgi:hypothetical protein
VALAALLALLVAPGAAGGAQCGSDPAARLTPCGLEVVGGGEAWRPENVFGLRWRNPPDEGGPPLVAVHYRALDAASRVVLAERTIDGPAQTIERLPVPLVPGVYTAEVWLEDAGGGLGAPATALLRFDDARPGAVEPLPAAGWIGRPAFPFPVRLGHPAGDEPLSGIRGYAVAIDRDPEREPCAAADRCTETETTLRGGAAQDTLWLASLPEGTSYAHAVAVSGSGMKSAGAGHTALRVDTTDPATRLSGVPGGWSRRPVALVARASDTAAGMEADGPAGPFTAIRVDGRAPVLAAGAEARTSVIGAGVHHVAYYARDAAGNVDDGAGANPPPATATVRIDAEPPRVAFAGAQDPRDPERIEARVVDPLSGPSGSRGLIALRRAGSGERFEPLPTVVAAGRLSARWDSDAYPAGRYELRATGFDRAGNASLSTRRANGSPMVLPAPLKQPATLVAGLGGRGAGCSRARRRCRPGPRSRRGGRRGERSVPFGRGAVYRGRLVVGRRAPLAGAPVRVVERFAAGLGERVSTLRTGARGRFALRLRPGPSREVLASYAGSATVSRAAAPPARLAVRGRVRMGVSAATARVGGRPVVFRGRVAGAIPADGKYVQVQFRLAGGRWTRFRTLRSDSRGRFRYAYRFSDDDSRGVRFRFRARAAAQGGWPYEPASSRPVAVTGL